MSEQEKAIEEILKSDDPVTAKKKLLELLHSGELSDDVRERLKALLFGRSPIFADYDGITGTLLAVGLAIIIFSVLIFFGYKLYKSIKEKERKKEDKKKAKQLKKKK